MTRDYGGTLIPAMPDEDRARLQLPAAVAAPGGTEVPLDARLGNIVYLRWQAAESTQRYSVEVLADPVTERSLANLDAMLARLQEGEPLPFFCILHPAFGICISRASPRPSRGSE